MRSPTPTVDKPETPPLWASAASEPGSRQMHPILLGLISGLLLWLAFPPVEWSGLAWIALVPLFMLIRDTRHPAWIYLASWLAGELFWLAAIRWVRLADETAALGWKVMATVLSLWWPLFMLLARVAVRRLKVPLVIAAPVLWVGLEYARAHFLTGFPWYYLAHTQAYNPIRADWAHPLIQIADLTGVWGVSLLVAMFNALLAEWLLAFGTEASPGISKPSKRIDRRLIVATAAVAGLLAVSMVYGFWRISSAKFRKGPRVALLQSDIVQKYRDATTPEQAIEKFKVLLSKLSQPPLVDEPAVDLIVWPETAFPYGYVTIDPKLSEAELDRQAKMINATWSAASVRERLKDVGDYIHAWTDSVGKPMLVGTIHYVFKPEGPGRYNASLLLEPGSREIQAYHKVHLVPFGEYVPLIKYFPWLVALTPYRGSKVPGLTFGDDLSSFRLGPWRFVSWICFEDTVPHVARQFFAGLERSEEPEFVVNSSNDGWFHGSEEHDMHLAAGLFRAVEHRIPIVRAVNLGISAIIDGNGVVRARLPKKELQVLAGDVLLDDRTSFYSQWGDWMGRLAFFLACFVLISSPFVGNPKADKVGLVSASRGASKA